MSLLQIHEPGQTPAPHAEAATTAIGIDLGTTHSVVAISNDQQPEVMSAPDGSAIIPSVVAYGARPLVGRMAIGQPDAIHSVKRLMGRGAHEVDTIGGQLPYELDTQEGGMVRLVVNGNKITPVEVSADILRHLKQIAELSLGHDVGQAVITVPAYFDDAARTATRDAARLAGLEVLRLINEPTAAALAYGLDAQAEGIYAIYDFGGGTFDISILRMEKGVFQVLATGGDAQLGGDDMDRAIAEWIVKQHGAMPKTAQQASDLLSLAREAKEALTHNEEVHIPWAEEQLTLNRAEFEQLITAILNRTIQACQRTLDDAAQTHDAIHGVVLVGGSTRVPAVRAAVEKFFGKEPLADIDPDKVVAMGAAIQAEALTRGSNNLLLDVTPLSLGLETMGGIVEKVIHRNTPIPVSMAQEFTTYQDGQSAMKIHAVQGEREMVEDCRSLANFTLSGIPPMPANVARIKVTFTVDADGLLSVSAEETTTGIKQHVDVKPSYGLEIDDIEHMLREGMEHARDDILKRLLVEARVEAERTIHDIQTAMDKDAHLLIEGEAQKITAQMQAVKAAIQGDDRDVIDFAAEQLNNISNPFAERRMDSAIASALKGQAIDKVANK